MAQFEQWFNQDFTEKIEIRHCESVMFTGDNKGALVGVRLFSDGAAYSGGGTVTGAVKRSDGGLVALTGTLSGNAASVVIPAAALAYPGPIGVHIVLNQGGSVTTVLKAIYSVDDNSGVAVDPGTIIPSINDLITAINTAVASIPSDYSALLHALAPDFSASNAYVPGDYVWYNGALYRFTASHEAGSWTGTDAAAAVIGNDLGDLKSALNGLEISEKYISYNDGDKAGYAATSSFPAIYRAGTIVELNGAFGSSGPYFFRISGTVTKGSNATSVAGTPTIPLVNGHKYCIGVKTLSGDLTIPDGGEFDIRLYDSVPSFHTTIQVGTETIVDWTDTNATLLIRGAKSVSCANLVLLVYIRDCTEEADVLSRISDLETFDETLENRIVEQMPEECANLYSIYGTDYLTGKGFSGNTGNIVNSANNVITGYIHIKAGDYYQVYVDGINILNTRVDAQIRKIALYDNSKVWKKTTTYQADSSDPNAIKAESDGYIRVMFRVNDNAPAIYVSSVLKKDKLVDLFVFAGQSNMAGRGVTSTEWPQTAPNVIPGAGYEFKSVTDPTKLYPIAEPFGYAENAADDSSGIYDGTSKTGDMVPAFVNAYYKNNGGVPLVGVSASEGGSSSIEWQPETGNNFVDLVARVNTARTWLADNAYSIRRQYCVWCQGESDGDNINSGSETLDEYKARARAIWNGLIALGMEKVLLVRIGHHNSGSSTRYKAIIDWQTDECKTNENLVLVSCDFAAMRAKGMMKDSFHYYQIGYNITGNSAGVNSAFFATTGKEPTMYDPENDNLYYSHKN